MDRLLADMLGVDRSKLMQWMKPGRYVSGAEFAEAGLAEMVDLEQLQFWPALPATYGRASGGAEEGQGPLSASGLDCSAAN